MILIWIGGGLILLILINYLAMTKYRKAAKVAREAGMNVKMPWIFLGHNPGYLFKPKPLVEVAKNIVDDAKGKDMEIIFAFGDAILYVYDPDVIREITVKNFDYFLDRNVAPNIDETHPETAKMLINLTGDRWKAMRAVLSPAFTSGKLKALASTMNKAGPGLLKFIDRTMETKGKIEMKETMGRYTMGVIAHAVFGVDAKVYEDEPSQFVKCAKMTQMDINLKLIFTFIMYTLFPKLATILGIKLTKKEPFDFFGSVTREIIHQRESSDRQAADMLQLLLDAKARAESNQSKTTTQLDQDCFRDRFEQDADVGKVEQDKMKSALDEEGVVQSAILFLLGGFDTTASTLSLVTYHLATKPDIQERAREEVDRVAAELGDEEQFGYGEVSKLEYLEMVINESFRVTPLTAILERICSRDYTFSNGLKIEKGMRVQVPLAGLHMSPKHWDNPEAFDPERFNKENKRKINPYVFMPFGSGPRNCIGMRFAMMEVKIALYNLLKNFEIHPSESTETPPKFEKTNPFTCIEGGNWLRLTRRNV